MAVQAAVRERREASRLPEGDVIRTLLEQHARIRDLFAEAHTTDGERRQEMFEELRALLAVHETAEEMVLRPVTRRTAGDEIADARNQEEDEATHVLRELEKMEVTSAAFDTKLAELEQAVGRHAEREEQEEFPAVRAACDEEKLLAMGERLRLAERFAPTRPHPSAAGSPVRQAVMGPFASIVDRVKDAIGQSR